MCNDPQSRAERESTLGVGLRRADYRLIELFRKDLT
jgi:hypothetical protein